MKVIFLSLSAIIFAAGSVYADVQKTICGLEDNRVLSYDSKIGRAIGAINGTAGCTVTMIGKTCAISTGHCLKVLKFVEFNVPLSSETGQVRNSDPEDIYEIDPSSIVSEYRYNSDFSVFKVRANRKTGQLPGVVQGHYDVSFKKPRKGSEIEITGYGLDYNDPERNAVQQISSGKIEGIPAFYPFVYHSADTMGGNSGSSIILKSSGKIIGIHTNGGCEESGGENRGFLISKHRELRKAIKSCLDSE